MTVQQALEHPYLEVCHPPPPLGPVLNPSSQPYHDHEDEPAADPLPPQFFDFDDNPEMQSRTVLKGEFQSLRVKVYSLTCTVSQS